MQRNGVRLMTDISKGVIRAEFPYYVFYTSLMRLQCVAIASLIRLKKLKKRGDNQMSERMEFNKKGEEVLEFLDIYGAVRLRYMERLFPNSDKIISYLIKNQRLFIISDESYISTDPGHRPDKCLTAALGVLADVLERVQGYTKATPPAQISFVTHSGDYYEIIYVGYGMEAMVTAALETQLAAKKLNQVKTDTAKRMIIVEDIHQIERLNIKGTTRFALVKPDGSLNYYKAGS